MPRKVDPSIPKRPVGRPRKAPLELPELPDVVAADKAVCNTCAGVFSITDLLYTERRASEEGIAMLDSCIAAVKSTMDGKKYDTQLSEHLAALIDKRAQIVAKLRQWGERVKTQSSELSDAETRRALAKFIATLPAAVVAEFRALLDQRIEDIQLVRI
jgi:hypothetical protein